MKITIAGYQFVAGARRQSQLLLASAPANCCGDRLPLEFSADVSGGFYDATVIHRSLPEKHIGSKWTGDQLVPQRCRTLNGSFISVQAIAGCTAGDAGAAIFVMSRAVAKIFSTVPRRECSTRFPSSESSAAAATVVLPKSAISIGLSDVRRRIRLTAYRIWAGEGLPT
jgi:hypothetical protein